MKTKVEKTMETPKTKIPAGLISGIEAFLYNGEKWVIASGVAQRFNQTPTGVQQIIWKAFFNDTFSQKLIAKTGITTLTETFDKWYKCVVGGLDHIADFQGSKLYPDAYNNLCNERDCPLRGKLCSRPAGLTSYEVETIETLQKGENLKQAASNLCISLPAIKSRVEKIKEKLHAPNMAALMARSAEMGI